MMSNGWLSIWGEVFSLRKKKRKYDEKRPYTDLTNRVSLSGFTKRILKFLNFIVVRFALKSVYFITMNWKVKASSTCNMKCLMPIWLRFAFLKPIQLCMYWLTYCYVYFKFIYSCNFDILTMIRNLQLHRELELPLLTDFITITFTPEFYLLPRQLTGRTEIEWRK